MPSISAITPSTFDSGRSVTLSGSGFGASQGSVLIGGVAQNVNTWSDTSITFTTVRGSQSLGACRVDVVGGVGLGASLTAAGWGQEVTNTGTITGPAPLAVFFDATATTSATYEPFREAGYHFDFGYATPGTPGTWTYSSKPKGNQIGGPVAAHVYETPGTYTASVRAQLPNGQYQDRFVSVVVQNPDTVYSGTATVLVSTDGSTDGAYPSASVHNTTTSGWPTFASDKRYLFKAGQDFSSFGAKTLNGLNRVQIGKFGSGADPIFQEISIERRTSGELQSGYGQVALMNLQTIDISDTPSPVTDVLVYRCSAPGWHAGTLVEYQYGVATGKTGWFFPRGIILYESEFANSASSAAVFGQWERCAILGCTSRNSGFHEIRVQSFYKLFIGHTKSYNGTTAGNYEELTLRGNGLLSRLSTNDPTQWSSRYAVVADCILGDVTDTLPSQTSTVKPSSSSFAQGVEDVIFERNTYPDSVAKTRNLVAEARRISTRAQTMPKLMSGATSHALTPPEWMGPYYSDQLVQAIDNVTYFTSPPVITPSKAGT